MAISPEEMHELAAEAKAMLAPGSLFNKICTNLVAEAVAELTAAPMYDLTARAAHARMKALEDIKQRLKIFQDNALVASRKGK
jgi:hypothetical protein